MTMTLSEPCAYPQCPSGAQGHQRWGCSGVCVCVSLFAVCDYACCHPAAVCMFYPAVQLHMDGAMSGACVTSHRSWSNYMQIIHADACIQTKADSWAQEKKWLTQDACCVAAHTLSFFFFTENTNTSRRSHLQLGCLILTTYLK